MGNADLPMGSGWDHVRAFERAGWELLKRRGRGSHFLMKKPGVRATLAIPDHKEVKRNLVGKLCVLAGISIEEYVKNFHGK